MIAKFITKLGLGKKSKKRRKKIEGVPQAVFERSPSLELEGAGAGGGVADMIVSLVKMTSEEAVPEGKEVEALSLEEQAQRIDNLIRRASVHQLPEAHQEVTEVEEEAKDEAPKAEPAASPAKKLKELYVETIEALGDEGYFGPVDGLWERSIYKAQSASAPATTLKKVMKELRTLPKQLEKLPRAAMFVRYDAEKPQFMQAVLTGVGGDTSYASGVFLFDIFIPNEYPAVPPKVTHVTPGSTTVNVSVWSGTPGGFSPNMHRDSGKVCLSLLGTWDGPGWEADKSSLYQVLSSISWTILAVKHPYYSEPGMGYWEGTAPAEDAAAEVHLQYCNGMGEGAEVLDYTTEVRRATLSVAVLKALEKPYAGFEKAIEAHFACKFRQVVQKAREWAEDEVEFTGEVARVQKKAKAKEPKDMQIAGALVKKVEERMAQYLPAVEAEAESGAGAGAGGSR